MDLEISENDQQLECVVLVPCHLHRSGGKVEILLEPEEEGSEQLTTPLKASIKQVHQVMAQLTSG